MSRSGTSSEDRSAHRRTPWVRITALAVGLVATLAVLTSCSKDSSSSGSTTTEVAVTSAPKASTTTTAASGGSTTTLVPTQPPAGLVAWMVRPSDFGAEVGTRYSFFCPAEGDPAYDIWGSGPYTDDSAICVAAVHAGVITAAKGGTVSFEVQTGAQSYRGSSANGLTSLDYGAWPKQFAFIR